MSASTVDAMTEEREIDPEAAALLELIDAALGECSTRSLMSADEMADHLLDIRAAACSLIGE